MSRPLQVGDRAIINGVDYLVREINSDGIYISKNSYSSDLSLLISTNARWQVYGYNIPHTVSFDIYPTSRNLTNVQEINFEILMRLPFNDLVNVCATNKSLMNICNDDYFWKQKILYDYDQEILEDKPLDLNHQEYYIELIQMTPDKATEKGLLVVLKHTQGRPSQKSINKAAYFGHVNVIDYLIDKYQYDLGQIASLALYGGQVNVLQLLDQKELNLDQVITHRNLLHAALLGRLEALKWLAQEHGFEMDEEVASYAESIGIQSIVDWLAEMNIYPDEEYIDNDAHYWSTDFDYELSRMGLRFEDLGLTDADFGWIPG